MAPVMPIAVVGMSCRFPGGANDPEKLWQMLSEGRSAWSEVPSDRYNADAFYNSDPDASGAHNHRGGHFIDQDIATFDAGFFGISPLEAKSMDPQQRITLEASVEALENAGIPLEKIRGSDTSVYVSVFNKDYDRMGFRDADHISQYHMTGNGEALLSNRISYIFDLRGTSLTLDTGCSGGLVALHQACQGIRSGESSMSIVGGVNLMITPDAMIGMSMLRFLSNEGKCLTFDERGSGYGRGEGVAAVILKPLDDAFRDNDSIRAIIRGTVANQDGKTQGITHPSVYAQKELIRKAYEQADLNFHDTHYVEAHGTGTAAGDPIETEAIGTTLGKDRPEGPGKILRVGSLKTFIGHLESVSGLAGLIKAILILEKGQVPQNLNFEKLNKKIHLNDWNLKIPLALEPWSLPGRRQVSVNSFGYGGTNAHAVLVKDVPERAGVLNGATNGEVPHGHQNGALNGENISDRTSSDCKPRLFVLSASTEDSLSRSVQNLKGWINAGIHSKCSMQDLAYTLSSRRSILSWKFSAVAATYDELEHSLGGQVNPVKSSAASPLIFVFTGQGAQWAQMGSALLRSQPRFRESMEKSEAILRDLGASWSLKEELLLDAASSRISISDFGQPASTAVQLALVDLLASWNIVPTVVVGHSSGEIAAAYAAGALNHEASMTVSYHRGSLSKLSKQLSGVKGKMLAVGLGEADASEHLVKVKEEGGRLCIACVNSPTSTTISGDALAIDRMSELLDEHGIFNRALKVDTAYHSHHMQVVADEYMTRLNGLDSKVSLPSEHVQFVSSLTGDHKTSGFNSSYWVENLVSPVRFNEALQLACRTLATGATSSKPQFPIIEIGPHSALGGPVKQIVTSLEGVNQPNADFPYFASMVRGKDATRTALETGGKLFDLGYPVSLENVNGDNCSRDNKLKVVHDLPPYPWDHREKYWFESRLSHEYRFRPHGPNALLGTRCTASSSFEPTWRCLLNTQNSPWVRGHVVMGDVIFPAAGYVSMAVEAMRQVKNDPSFVGHFQLRDISASKSLTIPDSPGMVEVQLSLRRWWNGTSGSPDWQEFRVFSVSSSGEWTEHCRGLISLRPAQAKDEVESDREEKLTKESQIATVESALNECSRNLDVAGVYDHLSEHGLRYTGPFAGLTSINVSETRSAAVIKAPELDLEMPSGFIYPKVIHPATLDACLQCCLPMIVEGEDSLMPTFFDEISISTSVGSRAGQLLSTVSKIEPQGSRLTSVDQLVTLNGDAEHTFMLSIKGMQILKIANDSITTNYDNTSGVNTSYGMKWGQDIDHMDLSTIRSTCQEPISEDDLKTVDQDFRTLEEAASCYINMSLKSLDNSESRGKMAPHHLELFRWMQRNQSTKQSCEIPCEKDREALFQRAHSSGVTGEMLCLLGSHLDSILTGEVQPLSLMLEGDLLYRLYRDASAQRCEAHMSKYLKLLGYKNPRMKILEIGAGTGGATISVVNALTGEDGPLFESYDFTDISSGFFEKAEVLFKDNAEKMRFKRLNIEDDPVEQGFDEASYDLIIAANVLHATSSMKNTLSNTRKLLKPNGRLIMQELTELTTFNNIIFGILPGWWEGIPDGRTDCPLLHVTKWDKVLKESSFSGLETYVYDYPSESRSTTFMAAKATPPESSTRNSPVAMVHPSEQRMSESTLGEAVGQSLTQENIPFSQGLMSTAVIDPSKVYVVLDDGEIPILEQVEEENFRAITQFVTSTRKLLWVTVASKKETQPEKSIVTGFARTARFENPELIFVTLEVEQLAQGSEQKSAQTVLNVLASSFNSLETVRPSELELVERDGVLSIPRLIRDSPSSEWIKDRVGTSSLSLFPLHDDRTLRLKIGTPGLLDSLHFVDDFEFSDKPLPSDELEIEVRAAGVNFRDVMVALGQLKSNSPTAGEYSGIVRRVGFSEQSNFNVGDRVCVWGGSTYGNIVRVKAAGASRIPEKMPFTVAASVPLVFVTAHYSLIDVARLQPGQTVLIHSAAGGVGQAAIMIAHHVGATVIATVSSSQKKQLIMDNFGIPSSHIFSSKLRSFKQGVLRLTEGKGVDVVLNSLSGEVLHESWACTAMFGTFVELGKTDIYRKGRLDMSKLDGTFSFASVDILTLLRYRPEVPAAILKKIMNMFDENKLKLVDPIHVRPITEIEDAFRFIQSRKHTGKVVLDCSPGTLVKAYPKTQVPLRLPGDASYIISGGTGGLGRETCRWMAVRGAKSIVLLSRSGKLSADSQGLESEMASLGTKLTIFGCDIGDEKQVSEVAKRCQEDLPPVRGIVHGAMVLRDGVIERMGFEDFKATLVPKVDGTRNLIDGFSNSNLDFFVSLSSCAGIVGNRGQANYASGGTFQDAIASCKFPHIKSMVTLDLGMVYGAGYISERPELVQELEVQGYVPVLLNEFFALFEFSIRPENIASGSRQLIIGTEPFVEDEGSQSIYDNRFGMRDSKLRHVRRRQLDKATKVSETKEDSVESLLREAKSSDQIRQIVTEAICKKISAQTLVDVDKINHSDSPADLGLDSLIAVELRNWIAQTFDSSLKLIDILKSPSITSLAATVHEQSTYLSELVATLSQESEKEKPELEKEKPELKKEKSSTSLTSSNTSIENKYETLPQLPLPDLSETVEKYLESVRPLVSPEELEITSTIARRFASKGGDGTRLQKKLQERAQSVEHRDWLYNLYIDFMYFDARDMILYSNYVGTHPSSPHDHSPAQAAAVLSFATYEFKLQWDKGRLPQSKMNDEVVCMDSFRWMFNACRIPGEKVDYPQKWPAQEFLIAIRKGHMFKLPLRVGGQIASISQLRRGFEEVMKIADQSPPGADVGALTSDLRDDWFKNREAISQMSATNRATLDAVGSADFLVCLDVEAPSNTIERYRQFWMGGGVSNRWYDKPVQYVVCDNGTSGFTGEHSMMDGMTTMRLSDHVLRFMAESQPESLSTTFKGNDSSSTQFSNPEPLHFDISSSLSSQIAKAQTQLRSVAGSVQANVVDFEDYGRDFMRKHQYSGSAYVHMIIQLASYWFHGKMVPTSDYVSTGSFNRGRLEVVRVVTSEAKEFCMALSDHIAKGDKQLNNGAVNGTTPNGIANGIAEDNKHPLTLLNKAIKRHVSLITSASVGQGIDMHLLALQKIASTDTTAQEDLPEFFQDKSFTVSQRSVLVTTSFGSPTGEIGYSPEVEDGFAVSFELRESSFYISLTSFNPRQEEFCLKLREAERTIRSLVA